MSKIIHSHTECGYRKMCTCLHEESFVMDCIPLGEDNFPEGCPLENGITTNQNKPAQIKVFKARVRFNRTRSKCLYHSRFSDVCMIERRDGNCGPCTGVHCGNYVEK